MRFLGRHAWLALALVGALSTGTTATKLPVKHDNWWVDEYREKLTDGWDLVEYVAQSQSLAVPGTWLRVGFIPRFGCAPLITIIAEIDSQNVDSLADYMELEVLLDSTPIHFPVQLDDNKQTVAAYFDANPARQITLRLKIDAGNLLSVTTQSGETLDFSLQGSRHSSAVAEKLCREFVPNLVNNEG